MSERAAADAATRERALDPSCSFIVQAPAGAGKTGLLIQRYLRLLATVRRPEEILAITFTRKAAGEMKRRVLDALQGAARNPPEDAPANDRRTRELAMAALARDGEQGWRILENTARLRIQTIDSFNASLTRQLPILAQLGTQPGLVDDARELFQEAAIRTLALLGEDALQGPAVERLLVHLDGDQGKAAALIAAMLARRDQWLGRDWEGKLEREALERALRGERARLLNHARSSFPESAVPALAALLDYATGHLARTDADSKVLACRGLDALPAADESGCLAWEGLAAFLLTGQGGWRKAVTKATGFPTKKDGGRDEMKGDFETLVKDLREAPGLQGALADLALLPPAAFGEAQWEALSAVVALLPMAAAQLLGVFAERGEVDHAQIAQGAVLALGEEDAPTDLLLAMDERLSHILVDEFQDTSRSQWRLLASLTAGWVAGEGRTVFAVGDPMQSIYRFREADVGLFLRAWRGGLPSVPLERLRLTTNFRSQQGIVAWVNATFSRILPREDDESEGAVSYAACDAFHDALPGKAVTWHAFPDADALRAREDEARRVVDLVRAARAENAKATIAILVRNRTHLDRIVPALREAQLRFRAVDIEPLAERPGVQDLVALTRALSHAGDRAAWLAVLRAPWCGLALADLHALAGGDDRALPDLLAEGRGREAMSPEVRERLDRVHAILAQALEQRLRGSLRERVEGAWLALGGPACLAGPADLVDAETFFDRLDEIAEGDDLPDPAALEERLEDLRGAPDLGADGALQVMTIHKAKGLQFSTVIVPGMDRVPRSGDSPLFRWKARTDGSLVMAPVKEAGQDAEAAYDYLKVVDAREEGHETERLFYVVATRAQERLHLLGRIAVDADPDLGVRLRKPVGRSLLGKAWAVAEDEIGPAPAAGASPNPQGMAHAPSPARDDLRWILPAALRVSVDEPAFVSAGEVDEVASRLEFSWAGETARLVGTVAHRWLQRIAQEGLAAWSADRVGGLGPLVAGELERHGVPAAGRAEAAELVLAALATSVTDPKGRWILGERRDAANEVRMNVLEDGRVRLVVMDRVFTGEDGRRWIVDYKTSRHEGGSLEAFLDSQRDRYAPQLRRYAGVMGGESGLGLYFPLVPGWREVGA